MVLAVPAGGRLGRGPARAGADSPSSWFEMLCSGAGLGVLGLRPMRMLVQALFGRGIAGKCGGNVTRRNTKRNSAKRRFGRAFSSLLFFYKYLIIKKKKKKANAAPSIALLELVTLVTLVTDFDPS